MKVKRFLSVLLSVAIISSFITIPAGIAETVFPVTINEAGKEVVFEAPAEPGENMTFDMDFTRPIKGSSYDGYTLFNLEVTVKEGAKETAVNLLKMSADSVFSSNVGNDWYFITDNRWANAPANPKELLDAQRIAFYNSQSSAGDYGAKKSMKVEFDITNKTYRFSLYMADGTKIGTSADIEMPVSIADSAEVAVTKVRIITGPRFSTSNGMTINSGSHTKTGGTVTPPPPVEYTLTATATAGGRVQESGADFSSVTVAAGTQKTLKFVADNGYVLTNVKVNGVENAQAVEEGEITVTVNKDMAVAATFTAELTKPELPVTIDAAGKEVVFEAPAEPGENMTFDMDFTRPIKGSSYDGYTLFNLEVTIKEGAKETAVNLLKMSADSVFSSNVGNDWYFITDNRWANAPANPKELLDAQRIAFYNSQSSASDYGAKKSMKVEFDITNKTYRFSLYMADGTKIGTSADIEMPVSIADSAEAAVTKVRIITGPRFSTSNGMTINSGSLAKTAGSVTPPPTPPAAANYAVDSFIDASGNWITTGDDITVAFIGDSVTEGSGATAKDKRYSSLVTAELQKIFSGRKVKEINTAISGTVGEYGLIRLEKDLLSSGTTPDIVFIAYGINDRWSQYNPTRKSYMDAMVRKLLSLEKVPVIMFVYPATQNSSLNPAFPVDTYKTDVRVSIADFGAVAENYGIYQIDLDKFIWDGVSAGSWQWSSLSGDLTHPNDIGYQKYADEIISRITVKDKAKAFAKHNVDAASVATYNYGDIKQIPVTDTSVKLTGGWTFNPAEVPTNEFQQQYEQRFFKDGWAVATDATGKTAEFKFKGTSVGLSYRMGSPYAAFDWEIFDKNGAIVKNGSGSTYHSINITNGQILAKELAKDEYTLKITFKRGTNGDTASIGYFITDGDPVAIAGGGVIEPPEEKPAFPAIIDEVDEEVVFKAAAVEPGANMVFEMNFTRPTAQYWDATKLFGVEVTVEEGISATSTWLGISATKVFTDDISNSYYFFTDSRWNDLYPDNQVDAEVAAERVANETAAFAGTNGDVHTLKITFEPAKKIYNFAIYDKNGERVSKSADIAMPVGIADGENAAITKVRIYGGSMLGSSKMTINSGSLTKMDASQMPVEYDVKVSNLIGAGKVFANNREITSDAVKVDKNDPVTLKFEPAKGYEFTSASYGDFTFDPSSLTNGTITISKATGNIELNVTFTKKEDEGEAEFDGSGGIELSKTENTVISVGGTTQLMVNGFADPDGVTYESGTSTIATVDANGVVTGIGRGVELITATCGTKSATIGIIVTDSAVDVLAYKDGAIGTKYDRTNGDARAFTSTGVIFDTTTYADILKNEKSAISLWFYDSGYANNSLPRMNWHTVTMEADKSGNGVTSNTLGQGYEYLNGQPTNNMYGVTAHDYHRAGENTGLQSSIGWHQLIWRRNNDTLSVYIDGLIVAEYDSAALVGDNNMITQIDLTNPQEHYIDDAIAVNLTGVEPIVKLSSVSTADKGTVQVDGTDFTSEIFFAGTEKTLKFIPKNGYELVQVKVNGEINQKAAEEGELTLTLESDTEVIAVFEEAETAMTLTGFKATKGGKAVEIKDCVAQEIDIEVILCNNTGSKYALSILMYNKDGKVVGSYMKQGTLAQFEHMKDSFTFAVPDSAAAVRCFVLDGFGTRREITYKEIAAN